MLTVKHIERDGFEGIVQAMDVTFHPGRESHGEDPGHVPEFAAFGVSGPHAGARVGGVLRYVTGTIYVMNEAGKTVGIYQL